MLRLKRCTYPARKSHTNSIIAPTAQSHKRGPKERGSVRGTRKTKQCDIARYCAVRHCAVHHTRKQHTPHHGKTQCCLSEGAYIATQLAISAAIVSEGAWNTSLGLGLGLGLRRCLEHIQLEHIHQSGRVLTDMSSQAWFVATSLSQLEP